MLLFVSLILSGVDVVLAMPPLGYLCSDLVPKITCQLWEQGLSIASGFVTLLVPSRLAFLQRSASGTALPAA